MTDEQRATTKASAGAGFRPTAQRALVLDVVASSDQHLTAAEVYERVRAREPRVAYGTVYRSLHLLVQHGLIQELTFADQASRYDGRTERHDHVHCLACGVLIDVDVPMALMARHVAEERSGFVISTHHTVFAGSCPTCRATGPTEGKGVQGIVGSGHSSP